MLCGFLFLLVVAWSSWKVVARASLRVCIDRIWHVDLLLCLDILLFWWDQSNITETSKINSVSSSLSETCLRYHLSVCTCDESIIALRDDQYFTNFPFLSLENFALRRNRPYVPSQNNELQLHLNFEVVSSRSHLANGKLHVTWQTMSISTNHFSRKAQNQTNSRRHLVSDDLVTTA